MPSWSIHLAIAKEVNKVLNLDSNLFYYGNLIPDVDRGTLISRDDAHYYNKNLPFPNCPKEYMIDLDAFLNDYKQQLNNPLILGYYCHLLVDTFYDNEVYSKKWVQDNKSNIIGIKLRNGKILKIDSEDKKRVKRKYKHRDFELYGKYLFRDNKVEIPVNSNIIKNNIKCLKHNFISNELVDYRVNYLNTKFIKFNKLSFYELIFQHNYKLFNKTELDKIFYDCVNMILKKILEICNIK